MGGARRLVAVAALALVASTPGAVRATVISPYGPGQLDTTFNGDGKVLTSISGTDFAYAVAVQPDGKVVVAGQGTPGAFMTAIALARYNADGSPDTSFGSDGTVLSLGPDPARFRGAAVAVQPDGKIVVGGVSDTGPGTDTDFMLARFLANGSPDTSFGSSGSTVMSVGGSHDAISSIAIQADGKIVAAGSADPGGVGVFAFERYTSSGLVDPTFNAGSPLTVLAGDGGGGAASVLVQPDGKIVAAGSANDLTNTSFQLVRLTKSGALDGTFGSGGTVVTSVGSASSTASSVVLQPDGKLVAGGWASDGALYAGGPHYFAAVRYKPNGALDTSFGTGGKTARVLIGGQDEAASLVLQPDGKLVLGRTTRSGGPNSFALSRYTKAGVLDTSFGTGGSVTTDVGADSSLSALALQPDGKIVAAGLDGPTSSFAVARFLGGTTVAIAPLEPRVPPGGSVDLSGRGFLPGELVDVYVDLTDVRLATADSDGLISPTLIVPPATMPGKHWLTAVGRTSGASAQAAITVGSDWTQLGGGAAHAGSSDSENVISPANARKLALAWRDRGVAATTGTFETPVEANGVVYAPSGVSLDAISEATGAILWTAPVGGGALVIGAPAFLDGRIYVSASDGSVYAFQDWSGAQVWATSVGVAGLTQPVVADGMVVVHQGSNVVALSPDDGSLLWQAGTSNTAANTPAIVDGTTFAYGNDSLIEIDSSGSAQTAGPTPAFTTWSPVVDDGTLYAPASDKNVYAYASDSLASSVPTLVWKVFLKAASPGMPADGDATLYAGAGSSLAAIDEPSGVVSWTLPLGGIVDGQPVVADGLVFALTGPSTSSEQLVVVDASARKLVWRSAVGNSAWFPAVVDGTVFVESNRGLSAFRVPHSVSLAAAPSPASLQPSRSLRP